MEVPWKMHHRSESCPRKTSERCSCGTLRKHQQLAHVRLLQRGQTWMLGHVHGDATVDVQNQICPLASSDLFLSWYWHWKEGSNNNKQPTTFALSELLVTNCTWNFYAAPKLHCQSVVQHWGWLKVLLSKSFDDFDLARAKTMEKCLIPDTNLHSAQWGTAGRGRTWGPNSLIGVCQGLDSVSDAHDQLVALLHLLNPVLVIETLSARSSMINFREISDCSGFAWISTL